MRTFSSFGCKNWWNYLKNPSLLSFISLSTSHAIWLISFLNYHHNKTVDYGKIYNSEKDFLFYLKKNPQEAIKCDDAFPCAMIRASFFSNQELRRQTHQQLLYAEGTAEDAEGKKAKENRNKENGSTTIIPSEHSNRK